MVATQVGMQTTSSNNYLELASSNYINQNEGQ